MHSRLRALLVVFLLLWPFTAGAQKQLVPAQVTIMGAPLLGEGSPTGAGWFLCSLRVTNSGNEPVEGHIELVSGLAWVNEAGEATTRAPFAIAANSSVTLQLPTHGFAAATPQLRAIAHDTAGRELTQVNLAELRAVDPVLFSLAVPTRVTPWLRGQPVLTTGSNPMRGYYDNPRLEIATAGVSPASGELILPDRAVGYTNATLVVAPSDTLARLTDQQRQALADWVVAGGALAVVVKRPEDLRMPLLGAMLGGEPRRTAPPLELGALRIFVLAPDPGAPTQSPRRQAARPAPEVAPTLTGYAGGNLHPSPWGASASYGLGEVHLLGFDATEDPAVSDPWVHLSLVDLVRHAWERRLHIALPHGETAVDVSETAAIHRLLDPNEGTRWAIAVATLALLLYSVLAGPVSFHLAARRQRPLRALWQLPIWSIATLLIVVALGVVAKGIRGEARHVTLIEAGAGMNRAAVTRFRAFYSPGSGELSVRTSEFGNVLDVAGSVRGTGRILVADRDGAHLEDFRAIPWQTVVVREDGFTRLGNGIAVVPSGTDVSVRNRTGRGLVGVIIRSPDGSVRFFERIADGEAVAASAGESLPSFAYPTGGQWAESVMKRLDALEPKLGDTWRALGSYSHYATQWWPDGVPVIIAQVAGGEGSTSDSGLKLREDRVLVRVVGWGGKS